MFLMPSQLFNNIDSSIEIPVHNKFLVEPMSLALIRDETYLIVAQGASV